MNIVELFSGSGTISKEFAAAGHKTFSVDIRRRKGVCEPDLKKDVMQLSSQDIPFEKCHVLWASLPCEVWSYAAGNFHWDEYGYPKTVKCLEHIQLLKKCLGLIEQLRPGYYFIENPRGRLRHCTILLDFLKRYPGVEKSLTYSSYGFPTIKPTNLFTNAINYVPRPLDAFGRGAKNKAVFDNLTRCQRQKVPSSLAREIRLFCEAHDVSETK